MKVDSMRSNKYIYKILIDFPLDIANKSELLCSNICLTSIQLHLFAMHFNSMIQRTYIAYTYTEINLIHSGVLVNGK